MVEFSVRIAVAAVLLGLGFATGHPSLAFCVQALAWSATWSGVVHLAHEKGFVNAGVAGLIAAVDAVTIAFILAITHQTDKVGFIALAPILWAARSYGANPVNVVPIAASSLILAPEAFKPGLPTMASLIHCLAVLGTGMVAGRPRLLILKSESNNAFSDAEPQAPQPENHNPLAMFFPQPQPEVSAETEELKENYRALRDHAQDLERRSRRDRIAMHLHDAVAMSQDQPYSSITKALTEAVGVQFFSLYLAIEAGYRFVYAAGHGNPPSELATMQFEDARRDDTKLRAQIEHQLDAWEKQFHMGFCGMMLRANDKIVGVLIFGDPNEEALLQAQKSVEEVSGVAAQIVAHSQERDGHRRRLVEAETLYTIAAVTLGAESRTAVAARVIREIAPTLNLDHVAVNSLDGDEIMLLANEGNSCEFMSKMSFAYGPGVSGWRAIGSPEIIIEDALADDRIDKEFAMKRRIGSLIILPLMFGPEPYGYITAVTQRVRGITSPSVETLRVIAAELSQAFARLENPMRDPEGLMTPGEFKEACKKVDGTLVYLEVLRRNDLADQYGGPALDLATRRFAARARTKLPQGGGICRRDSGDYVAYLPAMTPEQSSRWANDLAATSSSVTITTPDGRMKIPMAIRTKVAAISPDPETIATAS